MEQRNTRQKEIVKNIVMEACDHPTAEAIYQKAQERLPNISLGTVYRILKQLVEEGTIIEISDNNRPSHFDKTLCPHAHFICDSCNRVEDIEINANIGELKIYNDYNVNKVEITLRGLCKNCMGKIEAQLHLNK